MRVIQKVVKLVIVNTKFDAVILCTESTCAFLRQTNTSFVLKKDHILASRCCSKFCFVSSNKQIKLFGFSANYLHIGAIATNHQRKPRFQADACMTGNC